MSPAPLTYRYQAGVCTLEGLFDENAGQVFAAIAREAATSPELVFELGGVRRINSLGVRAWCEFMKNLGGKTVRFRRCSPAIVEQLNTVLGFAGHGQVETFLAPYACVTSGKTFYPELTVGRDVHSGELSGLGPRPCSDCADPMEFDDVPERYLAFLALS